LFSLAHPKKWPSITNSRARGRCVGVYRKTQGAWPSSLDALVPEYLTNVPLDPFDGKPLRFRKLPDGIVIYSIGLDKQDDGGNIDRSNRDLPNMDRGFRLWDLGRRRRPASK
jgi:hypothetical protein